MHTDSVPRDDYIYHHLMASMGKAGEHELMVECLDWMDADGLQSGPRLYIVGYLWFGTQHD